ncbi:MAG: preprotein translocase subunit SecE [Candidatus Omnitrophota bacterium]
MFKKIKSFVTDVKTEMKKVSWSTRKELIGSTGVVIVAVVLLTSFVAVVDFIIAQAVNFTIRQ